MRTRVIRVLLILTLAVVCLGGVYLIGYARGYKASVREETKFAVSLYLGLYKQDKAGNTNGLEDNLRMLVYCASDYYDTHFGSEKVTDKHFLKNLAEARAIAAQERTNIVVLDLATINEAIRSNRGPNKLLQPTATGPLVSTNK